MKSRLLRWLPWLAPLVVVALLAAGAVWAVQRPQVRLPGGNLWTLEAVTYGRKHAFSHRTWWQKLIGPILPLELRSKGAYESSETVPPKAMVLWLAQDGYPQTWGAAAVADDQGQETGAFCTSERYGTVESLALFQFPRRAGSFRIRFYESWDGPILAEFRVRNPTPGPHPIWKGEPLPITRQFEDLSITLADLTAPALSDRLPQAIPPALARLQLTPSAAGWRPRAGRVTDATGNGRWFHFNGASTRGSVTTTLFHGLWPDPSAWKLRVEMVRDPLGRFTPEEAWTVPNVPVPRPYAVSHRDARSVRQGTALRLLGLGGVGAYLWGGTPSPDDQRKAEERVQPWKQSGNPQPLTVSDVKQPLVRLRVRSLPAGYTLSLCAVDDRGRRYGGRDPLYSEPVGRVPGQWTVPQRPTTDELEYRFHLDLARDAKRVDLHVFVQKSRFVEFVAQPRRVDPPWKGP